MGKADRSFYTATVALIKTVLTLVVGLITTPYLLRWLGSEVFGAYKILTDIFFNMGILELGITGATIGVLSASVSNKDESQAFGIIYRSVLAYVKVLPIVFVTVVVLMFFADKIFPNMTIDLSELQWSVGLIGLGMLYIVALPFKTYYQVKERGTLINVASIIHWAMLTILLMLLGYLGYGIIGQSAAFCVTTLCFYLFFVVKYFIEWKPQSRSVVPETSIDFFKNNLSYFVINLSNKLSFYFDNLVISYFFGPKIVVVFFLTQKLPLLVQHNIGTLGSSVWASVVTDYHTKRLDIFGQNVLRMTKMITVLSMATIIPVVVYNQTFIRLWIGSENYAGTLVTIASSIVAYLLALLGFWGWLLTACGVIKEQVIPSVLNVVINLAFSIGLISYLGIAGPVVGTIIGLLLTLIPSYIRLIVKTAQLDLAQFLASIISPLILGSVFIYVFYSQDKNYQHFGWILLIISMCLVCIIYLMASWLFLFTKDEKDFWKSRIKGIYRGIQKK